MYRAYALDLVFYRNMDYCYSMLLKPEALAFWMDVRPSYLQCAAQDRITYLLWIFGKDYRLSFAVAWNSRYFGVFLLSNGQKLPEHLLCVVPDTHIHIIHSPSYYLIMTIFRAASSNVFAGNNWILFEYRVSGHNTALFTISYLLGINSQFTV